MKLKSKIAIYLTIIILTVGILTAVVVSAVSDLSILNGTRNQHIGEIFTLSYTGTLTANKAVYCIQKDKELKGEVKFILKNYVEINGKEALIYSNSSDEDPNVVVDDINAQVAYILNRKQGYGTKENPTDTQNALWYVTNRWTTRIFGNTMYSWGGNDTATKNTVNERAEEYAEAIGEQKASTDSSSSSVDSTVLRVTDKTNKENISVMNVDEYYRIGPFRWEFDGMLQYIEVTTDKGIISDSNLRFVKYSGTVPNIVNISDILTGEAFYIDVNRSTGILQLTGLKLKTDSDASEATKIYTAKIWFFHASSYQNLIYVDVGNFDGIPSNGEGTSNYNVSLSIGIGIRKVDDRDTSIPLANVGFTFESVVQTYDRKKDGEGKEIEIKHTKEVSCTHVEHHSWQINPSTGLPYGTTTYEHESDTVDDWTEYVYEWVDHTMYLDNNGKWTENASDAHIYCTNNEGKISIDNMSYPTKTITNEIGSDGKKKDDYISTAKLKADTDVTVKEVSNPYYGYTIGNTYSVSVNYNTTLENKTIINHQSKIKLSGYVWLDGNSEKTTIRNDVFDTDEKGINGITVYLRDLSGNEVKRTTTAELGLYSEIDGGEYQFIDVDLDALEAGNYYVEFEYCGITYQSVNPNLSENRGSKSDDAITREILDNKFTSVDSTGTQSLYINGVTVNYNDIDSYSSIVESHTGCEVYARTNEAGYDLYSHFTPTTEEIRYINLGLFEKAQTDFAMTQDLYNVRVDVNGFSHLYRYAKVRFNEDESVNEDSSWNMGVKFQNNRGTYDRAIYIADSEYEAPNHRDNEIKVYVTYKIALKNESSYLGKINRIVDYCDNRYELVAVGTSIDENDAITGDLGHGLKTSYNDEYSKYIIDTNTVINAGETSYIYVQFIMDRSAILTILNNGELLNNVAEIDSYTTFKENNVNKSVAVIDRDSVPGNAIPGKIETYEDDTDAARSLKLELRNERALTGTVFVDSTGKDSNTVYSKEERIGNGIYDSGEITLSGIIVKLCETGKDDISYDGERVEMETITDESGNFEFIGYIPGNYIVTYTWGNQTYKVQYYKGTIYDETRNQNDMYWYKVNADIRKTDALDNFNIRTKIDDELEAVKSNILEDEINKAYNGGSSYITQTTMDSSTPIMSFSVEYETIVTDGTVDQVRFTVKNVDFGIVERAKQQLELSKRVSGLKITSAKGEILVDAKITEDGKLEGVYDYTTYIKQSLVRAEMFNEIIEGSVLEITYTMEVKNVGELDYVSDKYYYYGNKQGSDFVRTSVTGLIDYVDGRLGVVDDNWEEKEKEYLSEVNAMQKDNEQYINSTRTYLTSRLSKYLAPGEANSVDLHTSKLLANTDDNEFNNQSEIVEVTKASGFNTGTPIKAVWNEDKFYFNVDGSEKVIIIPDTGDNKNYVLPTVVGIITLLTLGLGIVFIKRFIIK